MCMIEISNTFYPRKMWLKCDTKVPKIFYKDNDACISQLKGGFIQGNRTKSISQKIILHKLSPGKL